VLTLAYAGLLISPLTSQNYCASVAMSFEPHRAEREFVSLTSGTDEAPNGATEGFRRRHHRCAWTLLSAANGEQAMAVITEMLQLLGILAGPTPGPAAASAQLMLEWPPTRTTLVEGTIHTTCGSLDRAGSPLPRVVAFVAPETTLRGLGESVHGRLQTISAPSQPLPDALSIAHAIMAYHAADLELASMIAPGSGPPTGRFPAWEVGRGIRLPIEIDTGNNRCIIELNRWVSLAGTADPGWDVALDWKPMPLAVPDHLSDQQWAVGVINAMSSPATTAADLRESLLINPSKAVYQFLELLAAVDGVAAPAQEELWTTLVLTALRADETALLATTWPGAIALRAVYRRLFARASQPGHTASIDQAVAALNTALGIAGAAPVDLTKNTPSVLPRELPVSQAWSIRPDATKHLTHDVNGEREDGHHQLVLGRAFYAGLWGNDGKYNGPAYAGNNAYSVSNYVAAHHDEVFAQADATTQARLAIVSAIAANKGFIDAVRLRDRGILSLGVQQWTVHVDNELNVLLWNLAQTHPDDYDAHAGIYGLQLSQTDTWSGQPGMPVGSTKAVTLAKAATGSQSTPMPAPNPAPDHPVDRLQFFGGAADPAHPQHFRFDDTPWNGRVRSAARCSQPLQLRELTTATDRFGRIRAEGRTWLVGSTSFTIDQLVTSVQGAAQVLDQHINAPGHLTADVKTAITKVTLTPATDANGLTNAWLTAFGAEYLKAVRYGTGITKTDLTLPSGTVIRGRQSYIVKQNLSSAPRSFQGW
jgi:hypothetical protein